MLELHKVVNTIFIGVDIGGTKCAVVKSDNNGRILDKVKFPTTNVDETLNNIISSVEKYGAADAIGISCGGPLDSDNGIIMSPPNLIGWDNIHIVKILEDKFAIPAFLQNDANACALAEWKIGAGKGTKNMIFLTFGTGLGAGIILNGNLYNGTNGNAGEVGHVRLENFGPVGYGKIGSFEGFCSGSGIAQMGKTYALSQFQMGKKVSFCKNADMLDDITAKSIAEYAANGYEDAKHIYDLCGEKLGKGLSVLIDILNPEMIVIGSIFARCESMLREKMESVLKKECLPFNLDVCKIVPAMLGEEIGDYAGIAVAINGIS